MSIPSYLAPEPDDADLFDDCFPALALSVRMANLGCCLRDGGALCAVWFQGWRNQFKAMAAIVPGFSWEPGCGRPALELKRT